MRATSFPSKALSPVASTLTALPWAYEHVDAYSFHGVTTIGEGLEGRMMHAPSFTVFAV